MQSKCSYGDWRVREHVVCLGTCQSLKNEVPTVGTERNWSRQTAGAILEGPCKPQRFRFYSLGYVLKICEQDDDLMRIKRFVYSLTSFCPLFVESFGVHYVEDTHWCTLFSVAARRSPKCLRTSWAPFCSWRITFGTQSCPGG